MSAKDILISVFFLVIGILVLLLGFGLLDLIGSTAQMAYMMYGFVSGMLSSASGLTASAPQSMSLPFWTYAPGWIVVVLGITTIVYGIKRLLDNILKIIVVRSKYYG